MPAKPQHARPEHARPERESKAERKDRKSRDQMERTAQADRNGSQEWPNDKPKKVEPPDCWECTAELLRVVPCQKHGKTARRQHEF